MFSIILCEQKKILNSTLVQVMDMIFQATQGNSINVWRMFRPVNDFRLQYLKFFYILKLGISGPKIFGL